MIHILDANDNRPEFTSAMYTASLSESTVRGTAVLRVAAKDKDLDSRLRYELYTAVEPASLHLFNIDSHTGIIKTKDGFDR